MASDGLWDVVSNETSCRVARKFLNWERETKDPEKVRNDRSPAEAAAVLAELAYGRGSRGNISAVVVEL